MKKLHTRIIIALAIVMLFSTACFPKAFDPSTGKTYKVIPIFDSLDDPYPTFQLQEETPPTGEELNQILQPWGLGANDDVKLVVLDADWEYAQDGSVTIKSIAVGGTLYGKTGGGGKLASLMPQAGCNIRDAKAFAIHMAERLVKDGWTASFLANLIGDLADKKINADVVGDTGDGRSVVIKVTYMGTQVLILLGSSRGASMFTPSNAAKVSSLLKGLTQRPGASKKAIQTMATTAATFFKCVRDNWPKTQPEVDEATQAHREVYNREPGQIPADFPDKIPGGDNAEITIAQIRQSQYTSSSIKELSDEQLMTLAGLGFFAVVVVAAPEVAIPTGLIWATAAAQ